MPFLGWSGCMGSGGHGKSHGVTWRFASSLFISGLHIAVGLLSGAVISKTLHGETTPET